MKNTKLYCRLRKYILEYAEHILITLDITHTAEVQPTAPYSRYAQIRSLYHYNLYTTYNP